MYEKINVIVINSMFDMGTLDNAIGIKTTRHVIKWVFFKCTLVGLSNK